MKSFADENRMAYELSVDFVRQARSYMVEAPWRWIPASLLAVLTNALAAFTELFWVIIMLWFSDLLIGFMKAWHDETDEIEWLRVFRSVLKLFVITLTVIAMNGIEQLLRVTTGLDPAGKLVIATMLVIGSADAFSIVSKLTYFWPQMGQVGDHIRSYLGRAQPQHDRRTSDQQEGQEDRAE